MRRREFVVAAGRVLAAGTVVGCVPQIRGRNGSTVVAPTTLDAAAYHANRRYLPTTGGKVAYMDRGAGEVVLFLHGLPLNSYQWRGAIDRLSASHRCIAPDFLGLGFSDVSEGQSVAADAQVAMLVELLDRLAIRTVDVIASDSGGAVAQLLATRHRNRVRTMLLTNCDVEPDSPPPAVRPIIAMAREGTLVGKVIAPWVADKARCRAEFGAGVYVNPAQLTDEVIDYYLAPVVSSPQRTQSFTAYHLALDPNPLAGIESALKACTVPTRIIWGMADTIFSPKDADYLDKTLPNSRGVLRLPAAKLFFPEEYPDLIAEEARRLWSGQR